MELKLSRNVDAHVVGGTGADVNNGMFSKFLRQAMGRVAQGRPDRVTIIDEATERYEQELAAPGNAGRTVVPFDVMNSVLQEHGLPTFPSRRVGGRTRYNYVDADGQRSAGGEAFFEFSRGYARQRELGELFFYRAIQRYNDSVTVADGGRPIMLSEAIRAHDDWLGRFARSNHQNALATLNETLRDRFGMAPMTGDEARVISAQFTQMTQIDNLGVVHGIYPVSPYDDRYRDFSSSSVRGTRLGFIDFGSIADADNPVTLSVDDLAMGPANADVRNLMVIYDRNQAAVDELYARVSNGDIDFENTGRQTRFVDATDLAGLGRLRGYMRPEEYAAMARTVEQGWSRLLDDDFDWTSLGAAAEYSEHVSMAGSGGSDAARNAFVRNVDACVGRAVRICQALIDNGYDYEVRSARDTGQVELAVLGTGVTVRIMDKPEEIHYIGRVNDSASSTQSYVFVDVDRETTSFANGTSLRTMINRQVESEMLEALRAEGRSRADLSREESAKFAADVSIETEGRLKSVRARLSIAMNFDVDDEVFVDNVLYALGHDVILEDGHRLGSGDVFEVGDSSGPDKAEFIDLPGTRLAMGIGEGIVSGDVRISTKSESAERTRTERYDDDQTHIGAKSAMAAMVTAARSEFASQVNTFELAESARREAAAAFERGEGIRPDGMALPDDVVFGAHPISDPAVSHLREAYWRLMVSMEYDALVARESGEEAAPPRYVLANMGYAHERIYDSLTGVLVDSDALDDIVARDGAQTFDVLYPDSFSSEMDTVGARGLSAVNAHLANLMDEYFGVVLGHDEEGVPLRVNYFDMGQIDRARFGGQRAYMRSDGDTVAVGRDSEVVTSGNGKRYVRRGTAEFGEIEGLEETPFEGSEQLTHEMVSDDVVHIDFAHTLAFQPSGSYVANKRALTAAYLRIVDYAKEHEEVASEVEIANPEEKGTTRFLDSTLRFGDNDAPVTSLHDLRERRDGGEELSAADAFRLRILDCIERTLDGTRCEVSDENILIDGNGVVQYMAKRGRRGGSYDVVGTIGQVFAPDEHGLFDCDFMSSEGYLLAGGYLVHALNQMSNEGNYLERMRARSFADVIEREVSMKVRQQVIGARNKTDSTIGYSTSLDSTWRDDIVGTRFSRDEFAEGGLVDEETRDRRVAAAQVKCRLVGYDAENETSILVSERTRKLSVHDFADDIKHGGQGLTGNAETTHIDEEQSAIFDMRMMPVDKKCAFIRFLTEGAKIGPDGAITPGEPMGRSVLTSHSVMRYSDFDAHNRILMGQSNIMHATHVDEEPVAFAQLVVGGWTQDDTIVVSKHFAETHAVDGKLSVRDFLVGDKLGESHGNKGLVGIVIDPDMDVDAEIAAAKEACRERVDEAAEEVKRLEAELEEFERAYADYRLDLEYGETHREMASDLGRARGRLRRATEISDRMAERAESDIESLRELVTLFANNRGDENTPPLDVVYSPFSPLSRLNAGLAREALSNPSYPLHLNDGTTVEGGIGMARFITHDKPVDKKTNAENGRNSGYQLSHVLQSVGCDEALSDMFGSNGHAMRAEREAARASYGFDILDSGVIMDSIDYPDPSDASVYRLDENVERTESGKVSSPNTVPKFSSWMMVRGGYMELPFDLVWPDVTMSMPLDAAEQVPGGVIDEDTATATRCNVTVAGNHAHKVEGTDGAPDRYLIPVMAAEERRGKTSAEGGYKLHDHTNAYVGIYTQALRYLVAEESARSIRSDMEALSEAGKEGSGEWNRLSKRLGAAERDMERAQTSAQATFTNMALTVRERAFEGRDNYAKTQFMGGSMPGRYATAAWTGDPRLDLDEVGVGPELARALSLREGDKCLIWRAPCLTEATARAVRVHVDDGIYGVRVNPELAKPIGGDFDGDTIGIGRPYSREAMDEMADKCSVARELVNRRRDGHPLFMGHNTDLDFAGFYHPEIREHIADIERRAQAVFDRHLEAGTVIEGKVQARDADGNALFEDEERTRPRMVGYAEEMEPLLHELSDVVHEGFSKVVGVGALSFADAGSYLQSVVDVNINTGAKGSEAALQKLARNLGVADVVLTPDESGRLVIDQSRLVDTGNTLQTYDDYQSTMDAGALKSYATGEVVKFQQMFFAAFPGEVEMCDALSEPLYQMPLDWKHVGAIARKQHEVIPVIKGLLAGQKYDVSVDPLTGDYGFKPCGHYDENNRFVPEQDGDRNHWRETMLAAYTAVDKASFDPRYLDRLSEGLWVGSTDGKVGHMRSLSERAMEVSSPLLRAAFTDGADAFVVAGLRHDNLFLTHTGDDALDRRVSATFAPRSVRRELGYEDGVPSAEAQVTVTETKAPDAEAKGADEKMSDIMALIATMPQRPSGHEVESAGLDAARHISGADREPADDSGMVSEAEAAVQGECDDKEV